MVQSSFRSYHDNLTTANYKNGPGMEWKTKEDILEILRPIGVGEEYFSEILEKIADDALEDENGYVVIPLIVEFNAYALDLKVWFHTTKLDILFAEYKNADILKKFSTDEESWWVWESEEETSEGDLWGMATVAVKNIIREHGISPRHALFFYEIQ